MRFPLPVKAKAPTKRNRKKFDFTINNITNIKNKTTMKKFTLLAASCFMALAAAAQTGYVTPATDIDSGDPSFDFNGTTNYVILYASEDEVDALGETKILKNESPTDLDGARPVYIWDNTYTGGEGEGFNSFGGSGYMSFVVGTGGWSGLGHCGVVDAAKELDGFDLSMLKNGKWYLHMAMKDAGSIHATHNIAVGPNASGCFALGETKTDAKYELIGDFDRDGEWYNIDIPVDDLVDLGFDLTNCTDNYAGNVLTFLSGGATGAQLNYDAVFFYQKVADATGINQVKADNNKVNAIYTINGMQVKDMSKPGLYIQETANGVKKVLKK